jgi:hypothetical protein
MGEPQIQQILVEVRYELGSLYYDHSGRIQRTLLSDLGSPPFRSGTPVNALLATGVDSPSERITIEFGPESFSVRQFGVDTLARIEQVTPTAWGIVADLLEINSHLINYVVRFWLIWPSESQEHTEERLISSGLFSETEKWLSIAGPTPLLKRAFTAIHGTENAHVRYNLSSGTTLIEGQVPDNLRRFHVPQGVLLDVEHVRRFSENGSVRKGELKEFIRESWRATHGKANAIGALL